MNSSARYFKLKLVALGLVAVLLCSLVVPVGVIKAGPPQTQSGSIDLGGVVPGPPPAEAAVITNPVNGQRFAHAHITVSGTCPATTTVEIYKNDIFTGSTNCNGSGTFSLEIDLVLGRNRLKARVHDNLNQYGPDSKIVTIYFVKSSPAGGGSAGGGGGLSGIGQMVLLTDAFYQGQANIRPLRIDLEISGGQSPYALVVNWGDGQQDLYSRSSGARFSIYHLYKAPGRYRVVIKATDSLANSAYLEVIGVVGGPMYKTFETTLPGSESSNILNLILIALTLVALLISVFWAGERYEFHELKEDHLLKTPPANR